MDAGISFLTVEGKIPSYDEWEAAVECGATLSELLEWSEGGGRFPTWFRARVVAFHQLRGMIEMHKNDAVETKMEAEFRKRKK